MTAIGSSIPLPGPFAALLDAADVIEICANPDGAVFVERFGAGWAYWGTLALNRPGFTGDFFCSRLRRLYQGCSGLHRMRPPVLVAAGARSRRAAACCCTN